MKKQYPDDYQPPNRGSCQECKCETRSYDPRWLVYCPQHWQELGTKAMEHWRSRRHNKPIAEKGE